MKRDDLQNMVDRFVEKERSTESNPFLSTRVMAKINVPLVERTALHPGLKLAMITAGIIGAVAGGIVLGSAYAQPTMDKPALVVNDSRIENFDFYYTLGEE